MRSKKAAQAILTMILAVSLITSPISAFAGQSTDSDKDPDKGITLTAEKVDAAQPSSAPVPQTKEKKPLPIFLQPIEFVISSIVHAIFFWKTGDELN